jgi:hypothetical protein
VELFPEFGFGLVVLTVDKLLDLGAKAVKCSPGPPGYNDVHKKGSDTAAFGQSYS